VESHRPREESETEKSLSRQTVELFASYRLVLYQIQQPVRGHEMRAWEKEEG
jgi:hypothetical protein